MVDISGVTPQQNKFQHSQKDSQKSVEHAAKFGKIFNEKSQEAQRHSVKGAEEASEQKFRKDKQHIEDGKGLSYDEIQEANINKTVKKLKKKLDVLIKVEQNRLGL